jgi:hypothetical protein
LVACNHLTAQIRREMNEVAGPQRDVVCACPQHSATCDDRVHLFLVVLDVIVLEPLCARGQLELIDPKTGDAELICQRTKDPVPRFHLTHVDELK